MKKSTYLSLIAIVMLAFSGFSQISSFSVSPATQCYNASGNTAYAGIQAHLPSVTNYSWVVSSPNTSCTTSFSTVSTATGAPTNSLININLSCCGVYTIMCFGYNGSTLIGTMLQTLAITCPGNAISVSGNTTICSGSSTLLHATGASNYTWQPGGFSGDSIVVSPTVTTCYTVTGTSSTTCNSSKVICVNVQPSGTVSVSGPNSICAGSYATLYASGASNYTWLPGNLTGSQITVGPTTSACYTVLGSGCSGITSAVKCFSVLSSPVINVSGNSVCSGQTTTVSLSGASTYTIYPGNLAPNFVITPTATTCYSVAATNSLGCTNYTGFCVYVTSQGSMSVSGPSTICSGASATLYASGQTSYTWQPGNFTGSSIVVTPSVNTCYTVSGSGTGCNASAVKCLSVQSSGSLSISGPVNICSGNYASLQAFGGTSYTWYPGGSNSNAITVSPSVSTCYTLVGQTCGGTTFAYYCLNVNPSPSLTISGNANICAGASATLTATGASNYTWYIGSATYTSSTIVLNPSSTTCFSLTGITSYTNGATCAAYSGTCVTVQGGGALGLTGPSGVCAGATAVLTATGATNYTWYPGGMTSSSIVITPSVSTCYTVYGSNSSGCSDVAVKCVSVSAYPTITTNNGSGQFCAGSPRVLSASGASSYTWMPFNLTGSSINVNPTSSMCYTVIGMNSTGCIGSATSCFSVNPSPTLTVSGSNINCSGSSTTLTASGAQSYTWYPGGTSSSSIVISPSVSTCYTVSGASNGCYAYAVKCITVQTGPTITPAGNTSVCAGSSATIFANGALTYTWLPGNITGAVISITPSVSTCYTVVGTASNGCVGLANLCMQVMPIPSISTTGGVYCAGSTSTLSAIGANYYVWQPGNLSGSSIVISPSVTTCYTVTGTNSSGCSNFAVTCLSVIPSPVLTVGGPNALCSGQSSSLVVSGASSYTWLPGNITGAGIVITPSVSTCYTVKGYNSSNGCISQAIKCVSVLASPIISVSGNNVVCNSSAANLLASGANSYTWSNGSTSPYISVSPSLNTCYTVYGTNAQGCTSSAVKCITVQTAPSISINGPLSICYGSNATFIASGASSYNWNTGSTNSVIVVSPSNSTVYTVNGSNGVCTTVKSITLVVNPLPTIYAFSSDSTLCAGQTTTLTAVGANSYTWNNGSVSPNIVVSPSVTSFYSVSGTGANGCSKSVLVTVQVSACTGITTQENELEVKLYPNPISDVLHIKGSGINTVNYSIYDLLGREILKGKFSDSETIDLSTYANGTYVIRLESGGQSSYKKIVVEK